MNRSAPVVLSLFLAVSTHAAAAPDAAEMARSVTIYRGGEFNGFPIQSRHARIAHFFD